MAAAKWILIVVLLYSTENTSAADGTGNVTTYFLESCTAPIVVELHKDRPNDIVKLRLFENFPGTPREECRCGFYAYIQEFHRAWLTRSLTQRLSNYKVLVTLEDLNWPNDQCKKIFCVVEDMQRNGTTMCTELEENLYSYRFDLNYRRSLPLARDYLLDMSVAVAYMPYGFDTNGCPSNEFFQCVSDSLCIPSRFWCDSVSHCSDDSDERDCEEAKRPQTLVVTSSEEPDPVPIEEPSLEDPDSIPIEEHQTGDSYPNSDYSEEDTTIVTMISTSASPPITATITSTVRPTTQKPVLTTTTKRTTEAPTTAKPSKTTARVAITKKTVPATKTPSTTAQPPKASSKVTPAPSKTPTTTAVPSKTAIASTSATTPTSTPTTVSTHSAHTEPSSAMELAAAPSSPPTTTPAAAATTPVTSTATATATSSETVRPPPRPTQPLIHFSFTERPSILKVEKAASTTSPSPVPGPQVVPQVSSGSVLTTTAVSAKQRPTPRDRGKELYEIEVFSNDGSDDIGSTAPNARVSSAETPYPWSDHYGSKSRVSSAITNRSAPKQWVLVVICLILVFIYFFL